ncbi:dihydropteroate synthase [Parabacteroides acidifaciens]|uniref:dihydropteroate synthase n=1 Tax=Parabacteroides acidifaciens TaxID=2290935 RepID=A0A3D8HE31_9BACT|nr:dihydropteroate synthase [Parabacteroides acidifaciens]MBC8602479.1 dihydropteroate synthase [Parabacteroides acidifaciens]RDU48807.1 dihydropteroate synthase [Parabacteroides acidifaciens]
MLHKTLNIRGTLTSLETPLVMGILNITPDSFYADSRKQTEAAIEERIQTILSEGGQIIDIGGYSSRPDAVEVTPEEEMSRLAFALKILNAHYPDTPLSVDTFRADVARRCVEEYGVAIVNDISGGELDREMFDTVARLHVPYIMMHMRGTPQTMQQHTDYADMMEDIMLYFAGKVRRLRLLGVNDIILDPGFGFSKTVEQNYALMSHLREFGEFGLPLLVGVSRKSMIYKFLGGTPADSLNGTTVLNTFALMNGADILRVHDVRAAVEAVKIVNQLKQ